MSDPAAVQAEIDLEQKKADLCEAAVKYGQGITGRQVLQAAAVEYAKAQEHYLSVLATLGDGTS